MSPQELQVQEKREVEKKQESTVPRSEVPGGERLGSPPTIFQNSARPIVWKGLEHSEAHAAQAAIL
jgi:hypothetical protein